jgi:hypothetical protein
LRRVQHACVAAAAACRRRAACCKARAGSAGRRCDESKSGRALPGVRGGWTGGSRLFAPPRAPHAGWPSSLRVSGARRTPFECVQRPGCLRDASGARCARCGRRQRTALSRCPEERAGSPRRRAPRAHRCARGCFRRVCVRGLRQRGVRRAFGAPAQVHASWPRGAPSVWRSRCARQQFFRAALALPGRLGGYSTRRQV